jgi:hypothetical protein
MVCLLLLVIMSAQTSLLAWPAQNQTQAQAQVQARDQALQADQEAIEVVEVNPSVAAGALSLRLIVVTWHKASVIAFTPPAIAYKAQETRYQVQRLGLKQLVERTASRLLYRSEV